MRGLPEVACCDPGAAKDFEHVRGTTGHRLLARDKPAGTLTFEIRKRDEAAAD